MITVCSFGPFGLLIKIIAKIMKGVVNSAHSMDFRVPPHPNLSRKRLQSLECTHQKSLCLASSSTISKAGHSSETSNAKPELCLWLQSVAHHGGGLLQQLLGL